MFDRIWSARPTCWSRTSGRACSAGWASTGRCLRGAQPGLIYCAICGFGQTGPMSQAPAYDQIIQGLSGMMSITGTPGDARRCGWDSRSATRSAG